ncbi:MAG: hypothetical protein U0521_16580 [Anaerolineae bacterium]
MIFAPRGANASEISRRSHALFETAAAENLHLALVNLPQTC